MHTHHGTAVQAHEVVDREDDVEHLPPRDEAVAVEVVQRERPPQPLVRRTAQERRQGDQHVLERDCIVRVFKNLEIQLRDLETKRWGCHRSGAT